LTNLPGYPYSFPVILSLSLSSPLLLCHPRENGDPFCHPRAFSVTPAQAGVSIVLRFPLEFTPAKAGAGMTRKITVNIIGFGSITDISLTLMKNHIILDKKETIVLLLISLLNLSLT